MNSKKDFIIILVCIDYRSNVLFSFDQRVGII